MLSDAANDNSAYGGVARPSFAGDGRQFWVFPEALLHFSRST